MVIFSSKFFLNTTLEILLVKLSQYWNCCKRSMHFVLQVDAIYEKMDSIGTIHGLISPALLEMLPV